MKIVTAVFFFTLLLTSCGYQPDEPFKQMTEGAKRYGEPVVTVNGTKVNVIHGEPVPQELIKNQSPVEVPPRSQVSIQFLDRPENGKIRVVVWHEGEQSFKDIHADQTFFLSEEAGTYVFHVRAKWSELDQSSASYSFAVHVKNTSDHNRAGSDARNIDKKNVDSI